MQTTNGLGDAAVPRSRFRKRRITWSLLVLWIAAGAWNVSKPLPPGTSVNSPPVITRTEDVKFLADRTFRDLQGREHRQQEIFDAVFEVIDQANSFIVADFFLFNAQMGAASDAHRRLSSELVQHLIARKLVRPNLTVLVITDPINTVYGGARAALLEDMRQAGIAVVTTDLEKLRDSNPAYSALWRTFIQWWGNTEDGDALPNPFGAPPPRVSLRSWLALLNFKANHRKVVVADREDGSMTALVTSANPHDASSAHSNVGIRIDGEVAGQVLASELAVARFSGWKGHIYSQATSPAVAADDSIQAAFLTEGAIRDRLLRDLDTTRNGDAVSIAMFYLSDRTVIAALSAAAQRGVAVQLILDPNKDAFGHRKDGVPNRPVANELVAEGHGKIAVRWYRTNGEQFHTKLVLIERGDTLIASLGSANLTRRNLDDYNLEANIVLEMQRTAAPAKQMLTYFEELWNNATTVGEAQFTAPFGAYQDKDWRRYWRYRLMEATGLSTF